MGASITRRAAKNIVTAELSKLLHILRLTWFFSTELQQKFTSFSQISTHLHYTT